MHLPCGGIAEITPRLRYRVARALGFACPDIDDLVQETLKRFLAAPGDGPAGSPEAFLIGICRNVISEYRRRLLRDGPLPEVIPEPEPRNIPETEVFELRQAIDEAMLQLSPRDRQVLQLFYLEEQPVESILRQTGLTQPNFRVVLCRAKERFRQIYRDSCNGSRPGVT